MSCPLNKVAVYMSSVKVMIINIQEPDPEGPSRTWERQHFTSAPLQVKWKYDNIKIPLYLVCLYYQALKTLKLGQQ